MPALWLALHFPLLPLEALPLRQHSSAVAARGRILASDAQATAAGVKPGQRLSTALGLAPGLRVIARDAVREAQALEALACWAGQFTPTVVLAPPEAVLLEIGGCLRLFGGAPALVEAVLAGCAAQLWTVHWAAAPTPLGARWLACAGVGGIFPERSAMHQALAALPCRIPGWSAPLVARLESFGLHTLGDLARLPQAGLRARIGPAAVDALMRARGECPDPQRGFIFPEHFAVRLELPSRVEHAEALVFAGQRLLATLAGWLAVRQRLVRQCTLQLTHDDGVVTPLRLRLGEPSADEARLLRLLREHLERLQLRAPVEALALAADETLARPGASAALFEQAPAGEGTQACLERLRARLGEAAVHTLRCLPDHRPECATQRVGGDADFAPFSASTATMPEMRPLWLLDPPQALAERSGAPHWRGPLQLMTRGERLESGWWDEGEAEAAGDVRRDYFVARNPAGQWAWIFRDAQGWYLHGLFA